MLKLKETPYIVDHKAVSERVVRVEIRNGSYTIIDSEKLAWNKNNAYKHYDAAFIAIHGIVKNLLKPYFRKYKTKNSTDWYTVIFHRNNIFTCLIKPFNDKIEIQYGLQKISNEYNVPYSLIECRKLGDIKLTNEEVEEFINTPINMHESAISYQTLELKLLGEDGKYYG